MDIKKKLEGIMTPEDISAFEKSVEQMINEQVESKVKEETESLKKKYDVVAEEYCKKMIAEGIESEKKTLLKEYDEKLVVLEDKLIKNFDKFLDEEIIPQVSDETIGKIAVNEALNPIVNGIKKVLEENYISFDSEGSAILGEAKNEIVKLKKELSGTIAEKMQLNERLEKVATFLLINESTEGLSPASKKRVSDMFKTKSFDEVESHIKEYVEFLVESENKSTDETKGVISEDVNPEPKVLPKVADTESIDDVIERANKFA